MKHLKAGRDWHRHRGLRALAVTLLCRTAGLIIRPKSPDGHRLPAAPFRAIVIKPLALGDVLRTTPFLHALRRAHPQAHITYAIGSYAAASLTNNPHIDATIDMGHLGTPWRYDAQAYFGFARRLRGAKFDLAVVLDRSPLLAILPYIARIPYRVGLHNHGRGFTHTTRVPIADAEHEVDAYLGLAEAIGVSTTDVRCHFHPTPNDIEAADRLCQEFGIVADQKLVIVAPGGGVNPGTVDVSKRWAPENFARVADALAQRYNTATALVGLPSDATSIAAVRTHMTRPAIDLAGQTKFGQLAALIARSTLFIGNDSTTAQLAACVGTPSVTVFTTTEPWVYGAYGPEARWVYRGGPTSGLLGIPNPAEVERAAVDALQQQHNASAHNPDAAPRLGLARDPTR